MVATRDAIGAFEDAGGKGKPRIAEAKVCYAEDESEARKTALEWWPTIALHGQLSQDLALPAHYEAAVKRVTERDVAQRLPCGPDPQGHLDLLRSYLDAGYDHISIHQVGPEQEGFLRFAKSTSCPRCAAEVAPRLLQHRREIRTPGSLAR